MGEAKVPESKALEAAETRRIASSAFAVAEIALTTLFMFGTPSQQDSIREDLQEFGKRGLIDGPLREMLENNLAVIDE